MTDAIMTPTATRPDDLALSGVLPDFAGRGWVLPSSVTYPTVWRAVVNGRLPAQMTNGRYRVLRSDLPAYATFLGLTPPAAAKVARKAPTASPVPVAA